MDIVSIPNGILSWLERAHWTIAPSLEIVSIPNGILSWLELGLIGLLRFLVCFNP